MAKHIPFSDPVNQAETWAFNLLKKALPGDYLLLTNVEIPTQTGQAMEVDALVVGEWGVYVVDVKGYMGQLDVGLHAWVLDGREVENSLSKANYVARILAGNLKRKIPAGVHAPWCQGVVLVTGRQGEAIKLDKNTAQLSVYTPCDIVQALTEEWGLTSQHHYSINSRQRQHVLDTIGQVALVEQRSQRIQDFHKKECLYRHAGLEIWHAEYSVSGWKSDWILKILVVAEFEGHDDFRQQAHQLTAQLQRLQNLAGCSGVPYCAPLIDDGEQRVLPIRMPKGVPSQLFKPETLGRIDLIRTLRNAATSLQQIHSHGYSVSNWEDNQIFISDQGEVEFIDIDNTQPLQYDLRGFAQCFRHLEERLGEPMIRLWFARARQGQSVTLDELRADLSVLLNIGETHQTKAHQTKAPAFRADSDHVINHHYQLQEKIRQGDGSDIWKAWHLQGKFPCSVSIYHNIEQRWLGLSDSYRRLKELYHPNIERFIELGQVNNSSDLFLSREWVQGQSLRDLRGGIQPKQAALWFDQLLSALQYLHSFDLFHGGISLRNIICSGDKATLVNFGLGVDAVGDSQLRASVDKELWALEGGAKRDVFSVVASFIIALYEGDFPEHVSLSGLTRMLQTLPEPFLTPERKQLFYQTLKF